MLQSHSTCWSRCALSALSSKLAKIANLMHICSSIAANSCFMFLPPLEGQSSHMMPVLEAAAAAWTT